MENFEDSNDISSFSTIEDNEPCNGNKYESNSWVRFHLEVMPFSARILLGTKCQNDYMNEHAGTQCASMVATAAAMSIHVPVSSWKSELVDEILDLGHIRHVQNPKKDERLFVDVRHCAGDYEFDDQVYQLTVSDYETARPEEAPEEFHFLRGLESVLMDIITSQLSVAVIFNDYTLGLFCQADQVYFFDSHPTNYTTKFRGYGTASVIAFHKDVANEAVARMIDLKRGTNAKDDKLTVQFYQLHVEVKGIAYISHAVLLHIVCFMLIGAVFLGPLCETFKQRVIEPNEITKEMKGEEGPISETVNGNDTVESGVNWFEGPVDGNNLRKLKRRLKKLMPDCLQLLRIPVENIQLNKVQLASYGKLVLPKL